MSSPGDAFVAATGVALPPDRLPVAELIEHESLSPPEIGVLSRLGVETVAVAKDDAGFEMQVTAARDALAGAGIVGTDLAAIVTVGSRSPERFMTSEATRLQDALNATGALAFSVGDLGCAGMAAALDVGRSLLATHPAWSHLLIAHSSSPVGERRYRHPVTVNGDGACAVVLAREGSWRIAEVLLETNGTYWDLYSVEFRDRSPSDWVEVCSDLRKYSFGLAVESRNRFRALIARAGGTDDQPIVLLQHLSQTAFDLYEEALELAVAPICRDHTRTVGHLGSMDMVLDLHQSAESWRGRRVLALANSPVAAWGAVVFEPA